MKFDIFELTNFLLQYDSHRVKLVRMCNTNTETEYNIKSDTAIQVKLDSHLQLDTYIHT